MAPKRIRKPVFTIPEPISSRRPSSSTQSRTRFKTKDEWKALREEAESIIEPIKTMLPSSVWETWDEDFDFLEQEAMGKIHEMEAVVEQNPEIMPFHNNVAMLMNNFLGHDLFPVVTADSEDSIKEQMASKGSGIVKDLKEIEDAKATDNTGSAKFNGSGEGLFSRDAGYSGGDTTGVTHREDEHDTSTGKEDLQKASKQPDKPLEKVRDFEKTMGTNPQQESSGLSRANIQSSVVHGRPDEKPTYRKMPLGSMLNKSDDTGGVPNITQAGCLPDLQKRKRDEKSPSLDPPYDREASPKKARNDSKSIETDHPEHRAGQDV
ncbi:hypothetical protein BDV96DRAFT_653069 [Lophiotrema nucula]|uniref:Uncharacterized protein n=1 Tax=Lophiotrema nucula TaxID=690887 RepID=A0A6A5YLN0_9PLEO|nr:hypothetical protein BDV96DRAFT_653069 [Lophiotrema nucula]